MAAAWVSRLAACHHVGVASSALEASAHPSAELPVIWQFDWIDVSSMLGLVQVLHQYILPGLEVSAADRSGVPRPEPGPTSVEVVASVEIVASVARSACGRGCWRSSCLAFLLQPVALWPSGCSFD